MEGEVVLYETNSLYFHLNSVTPDDYMNTFAFLDKLAENLVKKQSK